MGITMVLSLLSGVALFLYGMSLMGDSLKKVAGNKLELILYRLTNTPLKGLLLGTVVTAIIQSSSATTVMVVGFVNSGMMKVAQAIGIIMGAIDSWDGSEQSTRRFEVLLKGGCSQSGEIAALCNC